MRTILVFLALTVPLVSIAESPDEEAERLIAGMDCQLTPMGKAISGMRGLIRIIKTDRHTIRGMVSGRIKLTATTLAPLKSSARYLIQQNSSIESSLNRELRECRYGKTEQDRLLTLVNDGVLKRDTLDDVQMFSEGILVAVDQVKAVNMEFTNELNSNTNLLGTLAR